jgi:predicted TIM-barrel fold metal-dependent hydrolase
VPAAKEAIDCLVNVNMGDYPKAEWLTRVKEDYFKAGNSMLENTEFSQLIDEMDRLGVKRAILLAGVLETPPRAAAFVEKAPDRFSLGLGNLDWLRPIPSLKAAEALMRDYPVSYLYTAPAFWGDGMYNANNAIYYPLYTKACEWDIPVCITAGLPGPPIPGDVQNPIHIDRVCHRFPELKICMMHGADPWWDVAIRLMIKYQNLHLMTSAWAPKYLPPSLLHYMSTRGKTKILFATDSPVLSITRCLSEARELPIEAEVLDNYLFANASRLFFPHETANDADISVPSS